MICIIQKMNNMLRCVDGYYFTCDEASIEDIAQKLYHQMTRMRAEQEIQMRTHQISYESPIDFPLNTSKKALSYDAELRTDTLKKHGGGFFAEAYFVPTLSQKKISSALEIPSYASAFGFTTDPPVNGAVTIFIFRGVPEATTFFDHLCRAGREECGLRLVGDQKLISACVSIPHPDEEFFQGFYEGKKAEQILNEFKAQIARDAAAYVAQHPLNHSGFSSKAEFHDFVREVIDRFKSYVENERGWNLLWNDDETPRDEKTAQDLFAAIVSHYCRANNVDLSREVNIGRGPVDFKMSSGFSCRALFELKLASNTRFRHGLSQQLPTYLNAEKADFGIFIAFVFTSKEQEDIASLPSDANQVSKTTGLKIEAFIVNAMKPLSASKL